MLNSSILKLIVKYSKYLSLLILLIAVGCSVKKKGMKLLAIIPYPDPQKQFLFENRDGLFTNEFGRTASFTIRLSYEPSEDVTVGPITSLDTTEGTVITSSTIVFTKSNYAEPQTVTIQGVDDLLADGNQTYRISLGTSQTTDFSYSKLTLPDVIVINTDKDTASIASSPILGLTTNESGTTAKINVVLSTQPGADVVIPGFSSNLPAECSVSGSITFTSSNWNVPQQVTVTGVDDVFIDGPKNCLISSTASTSVDAVYAGKTMPVVTVINADNDTAGFTIIPITTAVTTEGGGQAQFSLVMNTRPFGNVTITGITTSDATEGTISPANITFTTNDWNTPQILTITGVDDFMSDGSITYTIVFPNSAAANPLDTAYNNFALPSAGSFSNTDNDTKGFVIAASAPTTSITPLTVTEGGASQTFAVKLTSVPCSTPATPATCVPTSITMNMTNSNTSQYTISPASLTFTAGDWNTDHIVTVTAVNDYIDDGDLSFTLSLDTIVSATDYNGMNPSDISILAVDDDTAGFTINPAGGVTVNENDPGGTIEATITVVLNSEPTGNVTLGPIISTDTLEVIVAPTIGGGNTSITNRTLVFTPTFNQAIVNSDTNADTINDRSTGGWNVPQTVRVRAVVDGTLDGTKVRAIQFGSRTTTDTLYSNVALTPTPDVSATNIDSGTPAITLQSISAISFTENGTSTITFQIVLATLPMSNVTISNIVSSDTTEGVILPNGGGAPIVNRTLVFTPTTNQAVAGTNTTTGGWNMPQTVTVQSVVDYYDDGNISFKVTLPVATGGADYNGLRAASANAAYNNATGELTLTSVDNDTRGFTISPATITSAATPLTVTEGGANGTFTVRLNSIPCTTPATPATCGSGSITLNLTNNNTAQYTISPSSLSFTGANWSTPQTVTVTPVDDNFDENNMDSTLILEAISGSSTDYDTLNPNDVIVRVVDNDTKAMNLTLVTGYSHITSSGGGYTEYSLNLGSRPAVGNTVTVTASVPTGAPQEAKVLDADNTSPLDSRNFTFTDANWNTVQTFRVKGLAGAGTGSTDFVLSLSAAETGTLPPSGYTALEYNNYNGLTGSQTITNYHIGTGKKIRLAGATTGITEASATSVYFWVLLNQAPTANVTINFGIDASYPCTLPAAVGSATQFTVNTASLVITSANWNQVTDSNRVQITSVNDLVDDGDATCPLRITSVTSTDPYYTGLTTADYNEPTITVTDNDAIGILKQSANPVLSGKLITSNSGAAASLQYSLSSQPMTNVTLTFSDTTSRASYSPPTITFTPANYATPQTLIVTGNATGVAADEDYTVTATASSSETATGYANSGIYNTQIDTQNATNRNLIYDLVPCTGAAVGTCSSPNATGGTVAGTYTTTEAAGTSYFAIKLRAKPASNVTVPITSSNTAEGTVSTANLVFTSANWNTLQVVTITGVNDFVADGNIAYNINFGAMTGDAAFTATIPALSVTNTDNDSSGFVLTNASDSGILESALTYSFTIRLNSQPTGSVSIPLSSPNGLTITSANPVVFTTGNWNTPQTVTFTWTGDGTNTPAIRNHSVVLGAATSTDANYSVDPPDYSIAITNTDP